MKWYSQAGQDTFVYETLNKKTNGTFLDIGCGDPFHCSNTYSLEKLGWKGVLVDIDPDKCEKCRLNRASLVIESDARNVDWLSVCLGLGKDIDYLSLDIDDLPGERKSIEVLDKLFSLGFSFTIITSEHNKYMYREEFVDLYRDYFPKKGYILAQADVADFENHAIYEDWWIKK